jgi:hypothetical protein
MHSMAIESCVSPRLAAKVRRNDRPLLRGGTLFLDLIAFSTYIASIGSESCRAQ